MHELIKKVLKEYYQPFTITYFGNYSDLINEAIYPTKKEIGDLGYEPEPISDEEENLVKNYLKNVNRELIGTFISTKTSKKYNIKFNIVLTRHWFFRLHRTKDPKSKKYPSIVDPSPFEVIDVIKDNIDNITKFVVLKDPNPNVIWEINALNNLNFLIAFKQKNLARTEYEIIVISQIKGVNFFDRVSKNKISLR